jgi:hypothetical protein
MRARSVAQFTARAPAQSNVVPALDEILSPERRILKQIERVIFGCLTEKLTIASPNCMEPNVFGKISLIEPVGTFSAAESCASEQAISSITRLHISA